MTCSINTLVTGGTSVNKSIVNLGFLLGVFLRISALTISYMSDQVSIIYSSQTIEYA